MGDTKEYIMHPDEKGSINISEDVIAAIAASVVVDVEGVACPSGSLGKDIAEFLGKKNQSKGIKLQIVDDAIVIDVFILVKLGFAVHKVAGDVQDAVVSAIESMSGFAVSAVNVHVCGVALEKTK